MSYNSALTFQRQFHTSEGLEEYVSIINQMQTDDGNHWFVKAFWKIQIFQGIDIELFIRETFLTIINHLGIDSGDIITKFTKCLNQDTLAE